MTRNTTVQRQSALELVITRRFNAPARIVFEAWTHPDLLRQWWVPTSSGLSLLSCEMEVCAGGRYRLEFSHTASGQIMAFFGRYIDVVPDARLVWTNEESESGAVTTVTFDEISGATRLVMHERHASTVALDDAIAGMEGAVTEQFDQLDTLLVTLSA